jgi:hypothetical protein
MSEACQRSTVRSSLLLVMVGLVAVGCMSTPQRQGGGNNTGGEGPEEPTPDAAPPKPKPDAKQTDPTPTPDAMVMVTPDVGAPPAVDAKPATPDTAPIPADTGPAAVTFTELYMTIFGTPAAMPSSCAGAACHNPGTKDMVNMADKAKAYASLTRAGGPVIKGNPTGSKLFMRLNSTNVMQRMPLGKPALSKDLIEKVRAWIAAGANND